MYRRFTALTLIVVGLGAPNSARAKLSAADLPAVCTRPPIAIYSPFRVDPTICRLNRDLYRRYLWEANERSVEGCPAPPEVDSVTALAAEDCDTRCRRQGF